MQQPLYLILEKLSDLAGLTSYFDAYYNEVLIAISIFALAMCLFGFFIYRSVNSMLTLAIVILLSFQFILPNYGLRATASTCAILGVILGFVAFMTFKLGSVTLSSLLFASIVYSIMAYFNLSLMVLIIILICGVIAGSFTYFFPVIGLCLFTALWGGSTLAVMLLKMFEGISLDDAIILAIIFSTIGFELQLILSNNQSLFKKTMPEKLSYKLEKYRQAN